MRKRFAKERINLMKREVLVLKRAAAVHPPLPRSVNPLFRMAHHSHHLNHKSFSYSC